MLVVFVIFVQVSVTSVFASSQVVCWGDSMTQGYGCTDGPGYNYMTGEDIRGRSYPDELAILTGMQVENYGIQGELSTEITQRALEYYSYTDGSDQILIIEMGSNSGWKSYEELIKQYTNIIDKSGTSKYIILGDTDDPGTSLADTIQSDRNENGEYVGHNETKWEKALHEKFGEHFFNTRLYLIDNGLNDTGLDVSEEDAYMMQQGKIPVQLRADWTHFNANGYYSKAVGIYIKGIQLGYWTGLINVDGEWMYYSEGNPDYDFNGVANNNFGSWIINNGYVDFDSNGIIWCDDCWRYVCNGKIDYEYTGMAENEYGWWYFDNGQIDFNYTGMANNENGWWYYQNGNIDWNYTGMAENENGWWYYQNGNIDWNYTGMAENENGWWYYQNGQIDFNYTGIVENEYGWWYCQNGYIDTEYSGEIELKGYMLTIENGCIIQMVKL